jgi:hypothetical protein
LESGYGEGCSPFKGLSFGSLEAIGEDKIVGNKVLSNQISDSFFQNQVLNMSQHED